MIHPTTSRAPVNSRAIPSDEELMALPTDGYKRELLNGEIVMSPAGFDHGAIIMRLSAALASHVNAHRLGGVVDGQTGFRMKSRDVLSPDISFVSRARLPAPERLSGFFEGAPDLAVEVLSPGESKKRLEQKLIQYFENGCRLAWVVDPLKRTVAMHYNPQLDHVLPETGELSGEDVVPGFDYRIADLFA